MEIEEAKVWHRRFIEGVRACEGHVLEGSRYQDTVFASCVRCGGRFKVAVTSVLNEDGTWTLNPG